MHPFRFASSALVCLLCASAQAAVPALDANCAGKIEVRAAAGGPVFLNGNEATLRRVNDSLYEAVGSGVVISIAIKPDGPPSVMYGGAHGIKGVCKLNSPPAAGTKATTP